MRSVLVLLTTVFLLISCRTTRDSEPESSTLVYRFTIDQIPEDAGEVSAWIPVPESDQFQTITNLKIEPTPTFHTDEEYGNKLAYVSWSAPHDQVSITMSYKALRKEESVHTETTPSRLLKRFLEPDQLGIIDERVKKLAVETVKGKATTMEKGRAIYDFVLSHMTYAKPTNGGWGRGDTARACETPYGNCSDFHALFVSLARAAGIPARFHYGYSLKPDGTVGPHCWAQFFDEQHGWVPVDISEADKDPSRAEYFFSHLSDNRIDYTVGRDIVLNPKQEGEPLNFLITPYVEVDGQEYHSVKTDGKHATQ